MRQEDFREFERFCIRYDSAIDTERYDLGWHFSSDDRDWPFDPLHLAQLGPHSTIDLEDKIGEVADHLGEAKQWSPDCLRLITAKRARAVIQGSHDSDLLEKLDGLSLYLLAHLPQAPTKMPVSRVWDGKEGCDNRGDCERFLLRLLYLNEVSQCYTGFLSVGYADQSLNLLNAALKSSNNRKRGGESPYELVALYNKAQACFHVRDHDKALREFDKIHEAIRDNNYFGRDGIGSWWQWGDSDKSLFDYYVMIPAAVETADVLTNMQRTEEALRVLESLRSRVFSHDSLEKPDASYWKERRMALTWRAKSDLGEVNSSVAPDFEKTVSDLLEPKTECLILRSQQRASVIEWKQQEYKWWLNTVKSTSEEAGNKGLDDGGKSLKTIADLIKAQIGENEKDKPEVTEALSLWVKGLPLCEMTIRVIDSLHQPGDVLLQAVQDYLDLCCDGPVKDEVLVAVAKDKYQPLAEELRASLTENSRRLMRQLEKSSQSPTVSSKVIQMQSDWREYCKDLVQKLLRGERKPPLTVFERTELKEWAHDLGLRRPKANRHREIRKIMAKRFFPSDNPECQTTGHLHSCSLKCLEGCARAIDRFGPNCTYHERDKDSILPNGIDTKIADMRHYYDGVLTANRKRIQRLLYEQDNTWKTPSGWGFVVLKRWNSFTPALTFSEGGGYFLFHTNESGMIDLGIAIDPGYDFVKNFIFEGFRISDITAILVSHNHPDHIEDFGRITNLLIELERNRSKSIGKQHSKVFAPVILGLSPGVLKRLEPTIDSARYVFKHTQVLEPASTEDANANDPGAKQLQVRVTEGCSDYVEVIPTKAIHEDSSKCDSIGFKLRLVARNELVGTIGLPCDTKWTPDIFNEYSDSGLVCAHVGCIAPERFPMMSYFDENCTRHHVLHGKQHLYFPGILWLATDLMARSGTRAPLIVLSEFGEEMAGGLRIHLATQLEEYLNGHAKRNRVVPGDTGLIVDPVQRLIKCSCCGQFYSWTSTFHYVTFGPTERIYYICNTCRALTDDQIRRKVGAMAEQKA
ncbi:MAG: hypothetical protein HPY55_04395 [Firmicutes bacterium]|nr:hypothetical protein [Bacillota bacterium]